MRQKAESTIYYLFNLTFPPKLRIRKYFLDELQPLHSRNYRLIAAPQQFDVLKTKICARSEASRANMLILKT